MKILQINNYNYLKGGSEKVYQESIKLLIKNGHQVNYFSISSPYDDIICEGKSIEVNLWKDAKNIIEKIKAVRNFIYNRKVAYELDQYLRLNRPDVAHLHIFYGTLSNSVVDILKKHRIPIVQTVHEFRLLCPCYTCLTPSLNICEHCASTIFKLPCIYKKCIKSNLPMSLIAALECFVRDRFFNYQKEIAAFIMVSQFIMNKHLQYYPKISSKCIQIYNSVDVAIYKRYSIPGRDKENYYLYLGRLSYEKGVRTLIDVFIKNPNLKLKIAGTGPADDELKKLILQSNASNIEFLGFVSGELLYRTIAFARYTMVPSEWYENNPLSVIESLALGTPVIGSRIGGIPELIEHGCNGLLHEARSEDSLCKVLRQAEQLTLKEYEAMCEYSQQIAFEKFDNEIYYEKLITLYKRIINNE